jgi:hypothetical protein
MWLVLASATDASALWAWQGLRARGLAPLELLTPEALVRSRIWAHRVGAGGDSVEIALADGRFIRSGDVRGALNRISWLPPDHLAGAVQGDRDYAAQELYAFFLSWLNTLPGNVVGRPTPMGLSGRWRQSSEWALLAATAGLPMRTFRQTSRDEDGGVRPSLAPPGTAVRTVVVVDGHAVGTAPPGLLEGAGRLASIADADLLGVDFSVDDDGAWAFAGASPSPDLSVGGEALLDALADAIRGRTPVAA